MGPSGTWKTLDVQDDSVPTLLVKADLPNEETTAYSIHLSDLSRVWAEELSKGEIISRAVDTRCSIDPSEDDEQFQILIDKIRSALNHEEGTSLSLIKQRNNHDSLSLHLTAPLPAPLPELKWIVHLSALPPSNIGSDLVTPLLHEANHLQQKVQWLIQELQDKDRVISKITDRLETSGNDLTTVFPGVSNIKTSRKRSQREQLAKHVKGLGDFDASQWEIQHSTVDAVPKILSHDALNSVVANLPKSTLLSSDKVIDDWWRKLPDEPTRRQRSLPTRTTEDKPTSSRTGARNGDALPDTDVNMQDEDDEFQRQATPPGRKRRSADAEPESKFAIDQSQSLFVTQQIQPPENGAADAHDDESTTDDEDDLDAPPPKSKQPQKSTASTSSPAPRELETKGARRSPPSPAQVSSPGETVISLAKPRSKLGTFGGKSKLPAALDTNSDREEPELKPKPKLGAFGGKAKAQVQHTREQTPNPNEQASESAAKTSPTKHRLGVIGGKRAQQEVPSCQLPASQEPLTPDSQPIQQASPAAARGREKVSSPRARETSQERADRKRDELKRELESKAKAPAKKKRKF